MKKPALLLVMVLTLALFGTAMLADSALVTYTGSDGSLYVNDFKVVDGPIAAGNSAVYVVDGVIQPKE